MTTYGAIADELGISARQVARMLASNEEDIPWHRVLKAGGRLPTHAATREQETRLQSEGVAIINGRVAAFDELMFIT